MSGRPHVGLWKRSPHGWIPDDEAIHDAKRLEPIDGHEIGSRESWLAIHLTEAQWLALDRYDSTMPSGVIVGKVWRRTDRDGEWLGSYERDLEGRVEGVFRPVVRP